MNDKRKSDGGVVPEKGANKTSKMVAEFLEGGPTAKRNCEFTALYTPQCVNLEIPLWFTMRRKKVS